MNEQPIATLSSVQGSADCPTTTDAMTSEPLNSGMQPAFHENLLKGIRNALEGSDGSWDALQYLLPWCALGRDLHLRVEGEGYGPEELKILGTAYLKVLEGFYARREDPASQLGEVTPEEIASRLERMIEELRRMRSPREVAMDMEQTRRRHDDLLLQVEQEGTPAGRGFASHEKLEELRQTEARLNQLHEEMRRRAEWPRRLLDSIIRLDSYICIRKHK